MNKKLVFWSIIIFIFCWFVYSVREMLLPFVAGVLLAYLFDPIADKMEDKGIQRGAASGIITVSFFIILFGLIIFASPILLDQISALSKLVPEYYYILQTEYLPQIKQQIAQIDPDILKKAEAEAKANAEEMGGIISNFVGGLMSSGLWFINLVSLILITPIVAFYILRDWDKFIAKINGLLPREYADDIRSQAVKIDQTISAFLHGMLNVSILLGVYFSVAYSIVGLNFSIIIGIFSGLLTFIPFIGPFIGGALAIMVATFQFGQDFETIAIVAAIFAAGQVAEGNFITPKLVGDKIGVHPAWLIFGMLAGGTLLGFVGVLLAVPLTAVIGVLLKFAVEKYEDSEFYKTSGKPAKRKAKARAKK